MLQDYLSCLFSLRNSLVLVLKIMHLRSVSMRYANFAFIIVNKWSSLHYLYACVNQRARVKVPYWHNVGIWLSRAW